MASISSRVCGGLTRDSSRLKQQKELLFIDASADITQERAKSYLSDDQIRNIVGAYENWRTIPNYSHVAPIEEIQANDFNLSIPLYVQGTASVGLTGYDSRTLEGIVGDWNQGFEVVSNYHQSLNQSIQKEISDGGEIRRFDSRCSKCR